MTLFGCLQKLKGKPARQEATVRPRLEHLEDRLAPASFDTLTNVAVSITPSYQAGTATETITATVTRAGGTNPPPVVNGQVFFNMNNQTMTASLNNAGQASFTATLPLAAVATTQTLEAFYGGATVGTDTYNSSAIVTPVYLNVMNALFPSNITFVGPPLSQISLPINPYGSYKGESDNVTVFFVPVDFNYVDPGTIQSWTVFGLTLSGSFSAKFFAPYESFYSSLGIQVH